VGAGVEQLLPPGRSTASVRDPLGWQAAARAADPLPAAVTVPADPEELPHAHRATATAATSRLPTR
jgi:hypothetical protein